MIATQTMEFEMLNQTFNNIESDIKRDPRIFIKDYYDNTKKEKRFLPNFSTVSF